MRAIAWMVALVTTGWLCEAAADPPPPATTGATQPAAPASATQPAAKAATNSTPPVDEREQQLLSAGYRPQTHNGKKVFCKREGVLGSRTEMVMRCGTVDELARETRTSRDATEHGQRTRPWAIPQ